ncbi:hypothetical protein MPDQ_005742 [Monascus purpureus]|uniref:Uncharacterized protein n=1 Tax=Monascus purpureus TaxID=5098 RepID=A0A507QY62_MONPU|nr:hypothetical protein MPDQ_005742 [Monascus purpureus]BDD60878.1 hypothetical protein MAP00_005968 [Monascus purpureus]
MDWEAKGDVPREEALRYAQSGIPFNDVPDAYRPSYIPKLAGIPYERIGVFHLLVSMDELARVEGSVTIALGGASVIGVPQSFTMGQRSKKLNGLQGSSLADQLLFEGDRAQRGLGYGQHQDDGKEIC